MLLGLYVKHTVSFNAVRSSGYLPRNSYVKSSMLDVMPLELWVLPMDYATCKMNFKRNFAKRLSIKKESKIGDVFRGYKILFTSGSKTVSRVG